MDVVPTGSNDPAAFAIAAGRARRPRRLTTTVTLVSAGIVVFAFGAVMRLSYGPIGRGDQGLVTIPETGSVVLEPQKWIGARFPLLKYTDIGTELGRGHWKVLLIQPGCSDCEEAIRRMADASRRGVASPAEWVIISLSSAPLSDSTATLNLGRRFGRLDAHHDWFAEVPVEIEMENAIVQSVKHR
jgi:hypothetical protein